MSQAENVLKYLKENPSGITPLDALNMFGSFRLAAIIYDLKDEGHNIVTKSETKGKKTYARYHYLQPDQIGVQEELEV